MCCFPPAQTEACLSENRVPVLNGCLHPQWAKFFFYQMLDDYGVKCWAEFCKHHPNTSSFPLGDSGSGAVNIASSVRLICKLKRVKWERQSEVMLSLSSLSKHFIFKDVSATGQQSFKQVTEGFFGTAEGCSFVAEWHSSLTRGDAEYLPEDVSEFLCTSL